VPPVDLAVSRYSAFENRYSNLTAGLSGGTYLPPDELAAG